MGTSAQEAEDARKGLERLRQAVESHSFWYEEQRISFTVTIGAAPFAGSTVHEWVNEADRLLYEGKQAGKNRVIVGAVLNKQP